MFGIRTDPTSVQHFYTFTGYWHPFEIWIHGTVLIYRYLLAGGILVNGNGINEVSFLVIEDLRMAVSVKTLKLLSPAHQFLHVE